MISPSRVEVEVVTAVPQNPNVCLILPRYKHGFGEDNYVRQVREIFPYHMKILDYLDYTEPLSFPHVGDTNFIVPNLTMPMSTTAILDEIFGTTLIVPMLWYVLPICIKDESSLRPDFSYKTVRRETLKYVRFLMDRCPFRTKITIIGGRGDAFFAADHLR